MNLNYTEPFHDQPMPEANQSFVYEIIAMRRFGLICCGEARIAVQLLNFSSQTMIFQGYENPAQEARIQPKISHERIILPMRLESIPGAPRML